MNAQLSNLEKIALLFVILGERLSKQIMGLLYPEELKEITKVLNKMNEVQPKHIEQVIYEFSKRISANEEQVVERRNFINTSTTTPLYEKTDSKELGELLQQEKAQTIADMLSYLEPQRAAAIFSALPKEKQTDLILSFDQIDEASKFISKIIEHIEPKEQVEVLELIELVRPELTQKLLSV